MTQVNGTASSPPVQTAERKITIDDIVRLFALARSLMNGMGILVGSAQRELSTSQNKIHDLVSANGSELIEKAKEMAEFFEKAEIIMAFAMIAALAAGGAGVAIMAGSTSVIASMVELLATLVELVMQIWSAVKQIQGALVKKEMAGLTRETSEYKISLDATYATIDGLNDKLAAIYKDVAKLEKSLQKLLASNGKMQRAGSDQVKNIKLVG